MQTGKIIFLFASALLLASCSTTFKTIPVKNFPPALTNRIQLRNFTIYQDKLDELVGHVLVVNKKDGQCQDAVKVFDAVSVSRDAYLLPGEKLETKTLSRLMYESRDEVGTGNDVNNLLAGVNLAGAGAVEYIITDSFQVAVPAGKFDTKKLDAIQGNLASKQDICALYLIKGATLSLINYKTYVKVSSKWSISGTAFGLNGNVYDSSSGFESGFILGLEIGPIADIFALPASLSRSKGLGQSSVLAASQPMVPFDVSTPAVQVVKEPLVMQIPDKGLQIIDMER